MAKWLRQSTASQEIVIGRMVDATDGNTAETGLTIANTDIDLWKHGATTLADKNSGGGTHIAGGLYSAVLDATDTNTLGNLKIFVQVSGALSWEDSFIVLPAVVFDALVLGTDLLDVSVTQWLGTAAATPTVAGVPEVDVTHWIGTAAATPTVAGVPEVDVTHFGGTAGAFASGVPAVNATQISGDSTAADNLETAFDGTAGAVSWMGIVDQGTAQSATSTTLVLRSAAAFADDEIIGATIYIVSATAGAGQARLITDYVSSTDTATVEAWTTTPTGTIVYKIFATASGSGGSGLDAAGTRAALGMASANLDTQVAAIKADTAAILVDTGTTLDARIPAALVSGRMDSNVSYIGGAALSTTSAQLGVNVVQISADGTAADNLESAYDGTGYKDVDNVYFIRSNTAQAGAAGSITLDASASAVDDFYNNTIVQIISGTGAGQARFASDYVGSTKVLTVNANWVTNPDNTSVFAILPFGSIPGATAPTAADIWTYATRRVSDATNITSTGGTIPITAGSLVSADVTAISTDATAANNLESALDGTGGVTITAALTGAITGNITGNVSGSVGSVTGSVGSVVGAVGSVTGNVGGNVAGNVNGSVGSVATTVDANVTKVIGITVDGSGTEADPWGPA